MATEQEIVKAAMKILGGRTSPRKARSSRRNGRLAWSKRRKELDEIAVMTEAQTLSQAMSILGKRSVQRLKRTATEPPIRSGKLIIFVWPRTVITPADYSILTLKEKIKVASRLVRLAIVQARIRSKELCSKCQRCNGLPGFKRIVAHHPDYDRPMEVEFMCQNCHTELHRGCRHVYP